MFLPGKEVLIILMEFTSDLGRKRISLLKGDLDLCRFGSLFIFNKKNVIKSYLFNF